MTQSGHQPKGLLTNAMWNAGYIVFTMVISFIITPILLRHLGQATYGILVLIWSVAGILGTMNLGLGEATLRFVARYASQGNMAGVNRVFGAVVSLFVMVSVLLIIAMFFGAPAVARWLNAPAESTDLVAWLLRLSAITIALTILMSPFVAIPRALHRFDISSKINMGSGMIRSIGYIALALAGLDIVAFVAWDLLITIALFGLVLIVAKRLLPPLQTFPSFSLSGLSEVLGYSVFSFLTFFVHTFHRESGRLLIARFLGPAPVVYLSTPDNVAQRLHEVIANGVESTLPRFSAQGRTTEIEKLFWDATWMGVALSAIVFVPFMILVPDFLRLWIDADFATHSAPIGQLIGLYLISQGGFAVPAAFFRGVGKPWVVTLVILGSLVITVGAGLALIPAYGPIGAAYAYLAGSASPFLGMTLGSLYAFGFSAWRRQIRAIALPLISAGVAGAVGLKIAEHLSADTWALLLISGAILTTISGTFVLGADYLSGGSQSTALQLIRALARRIPSRFVPRRLSW